MTSKDGIICIPIKTVMPLIVLNLLSAYDDDINDNVVMFIMPYLHVLL